MRYLFVHVRHKINAKTENEQKASRRQIRLYRTLATNRNSEEKWRKVNDLIYFSFVSFRFTEQKKDEWSKKKQLQHHRRNNQPQIYSNSHHHKRCFAAAKMCSRFFYNSKQWKTTALCMCWRWWYNLSEWSSKKTASNILTFWKWPMKVTIHLNWLSNTHYIWSDIKLHLNKLCKCKFMLNKSK